MTELITRRSFLIGTAALAATSSTMAAAMLESSSHTIQMLNINPDNRRDRMVFLPQILKIAPGDSVTFKPSNPGHNSETIRGMVPEGAEGWKGAANKEITVTPTVPGLYGYKCTPHYAAGMVGLIIVEGDGMLNNLEAAKSVRQAGLARRRWTAIFEQAENDGILG